MIAFDLSMSNVQAASASASARRRIDAFVDSGRANVDHRLCRFAAQLESSPDELRSDAEAQRRFTTLRLAAGAMLSRFDLYADALTQRGEHRVGLWLAGLESAAEDALRIPEVTAPPVLCYLDRGSGAAIRRARTRLPGGGTNPVALIRIPRERMVGSGVASSLVHEVGHQGIALLGLVASVRSAIAGLAECSGRAWPLWSAWLNEILADSWAVARVGPAAVLGLISVVSLPSAFVFRVAPEDPHPFPWIRVRLACALANEIYPHPQWCALDALWRRLYPVRGLDRDKLRLLEELSATMRGLARLIADHRPRRLGGRTLREALVRPGGSPADLEAEWAGWASGVSVPEDRRPCRALAVLGQAKVRNRMNAARESRLMEQLLTSWALRRSRGEARRCS